MWLPSNLVRRYLGWCVIFSLLHLTYHRCVFNNTVLLVCSDAIRCWVGCAVCLTWWISLSSCCSLFATLPKNQLFSDSISHVIVRLGFHCFFSPELSLKSLTWLLPLSGENGRSQDVHLLHRVVNICTFTELTDSAVATKATQLTYPQTESSSLKMNQVGCSMIFRETR